MTHRLRIGLLVASTGVLLLAACGQTHHQPTRAPISAANVAATATAKAGGQAVAGGSEGAQLFASQGCVGCHKVKDQGGGALGPDLSTIGSSAATRKSGTDAKGYLHERIVNPNAFVVQGFQPNVMPGTYGQTLQPQQIDALVNYLLEQQ